MLSAPPVWGLKYWVAGLPLPRPLCARVRAPSFAPAGVRAWAPRDGRDRRAQQRAAAAPHPAAQRGEQQAGGGEAGGGGWSARRAQRRAAGGRCEVAFALTPATVGERPPSPPRPCLAPRQHATLLAPCTERPASSPNHSVASSSSTAATPLTASPAVGAAGRGATADEFARHLCKSGTADRWFTDQITPPGTGEASSLLPGRSPVRVRARAPSQRARPLPPACEQTHETRSATAASWRWTMLPPKLCTRHSGASSRSQARRGSRAPLHPNRRRAR